MSLHRKIFALLLLLSGLVVLPAAADHVYPIQVERSGGKVLNALATKVNDTHFITDARLLKSAKTILLIDNSVAPAAKIVATVVVSDQDRQIAVLSASNITGQSVTFAMQPQPVGGQLILLTDSEATPTLVQRLEPMTELALGDVYVHTALYNEQQWAAPLLNNCQQLVGLSVFESGVFTGMQTPEIIAYAQSSEWIKEFLTTNSIAFKTAPQVCLSDVEQAKELALQAAKEAEEAIAAKDAADVEAQKKLEEIREKAEQDKLNAEKILKEAQEQADKIAAENAQNKIKTEEAIKKAEEERLKLAESAKEAELKAQQEADKNKQAQQQKMYIALAAGALLLVMLLVFVLVIRKRKRAMSDQDSQLQEKVKEASGLAQENDDLTDKLADMQRSYNDILLNGTAADGRQIRLKINGKLLAQSEGQVIGRESTKVDYVLAEVEISRKHLMLTLHENKVFVEDMQSQNCSWINGIQLIPGHPVELANGSVLTLSTIAFQVTYL